MRMRVVAFAVAALIAPGSPVTKPQLRVEMRPIAAGAELITVFGTVPEKGGSVSVPLVAVLRDTLGDDNPDNDRLRYVWVLTSARPTLLQRGAATLPFFYWRPDLGKNADRTPAPAIDLSAASHPVWKSLAGSATQVMALNSNGTLLRASSERYRANVQDHQRAQLMEGLAVLSQLENKVEGTDRLSESERVEIESRLTLAGQTLGGLVNSKKLPEAYLKQRTQTEETLGHNWELLRQRAEPNGLYFEPLGSNATHALRVAKEDAVGLGVEKRRFDGRLLGISSPFGDARVRNWSGYSLRRTFDSEERVIEPGLAGAREVGLIPLALYALDYPKVPLLLADFRAFRSAKHREMLRRAATDTVSGVLGVSTWGNWPYLDEYKDRKRRLRQVDMIVFARDHWNFNVRGFNPGRNHGAFFQPSTHSVMLFAGGGETGVPKGLRVEEPYDSLSLVPTLLTLLGKPEPGLPGPVIDVGRAVMPASRPTGRLVFALR